MSMHCTPCLGANHRGCKVMLPLEWEDDIGRCICKCRSRGETRLTNVERLSEEARAKTRLPPGPRKGVALGPRQWPEERVRHLCELSADGLTSRQIGEKVGADATTVRTYLSKAKKKGWR